MFSYVNWFCHRCSKVMEPSVSKHWLTFAFSFKAWASIFFPQQNLYFLWFEWPPNVCRNAAPNKHLESFWGSACVGVLCGQSAKPLPWSFRFRRTGSQCFNTFRAWAPILFSLRLSKGFSQAKVWSFGFRRASLHDFLLFRAWAPTLFSIDEQVGNL